MDGLRVSISSIDDAVFQKITELGDDKAIVLISAIATVVTAITAIVTALSYMRRKSYEIMITHRLDSLDSIRKDFSKLTYYFSPEGIRYAKKQGMSLKEYDARISKIVCNLRMQMKVFYTQEKRLLNLINKVHELARQYFSQKQKDVTAEFKHYLTKLDEEYAIYDWALWGYHQKLHKRVRNHSKKFNKIYGQIRKNSDTFAREREDYDQLLEKNLSGEKKTLSELSGGSRRQRIQMKRKLERMVMLGMIQKESKKFLGIEYAEKYYKIITRYTEEDFCKCAR